jgi:predicted RNase H-like nuclease
MYVGVDGCAAGWFAVGLAGLGEPRLAVFADVAALWRAYAEADLVLIDIPIGLVDEGADERTCDIAARRLLAPDLTSSVFPAPCREAVYAASYKKACAINEERTTKKLSKQSWGLVPKIREVDALLLDDGAARERITEVHPEICFWALAGGRPMNYPKRAEQGYLERAHVLEAAYPGAYDIIARALADYPRSAVGRDDVLDALSAAVTAGAGPGGLASIPPEPQTDSKGLPIQMVYSPQFLEYEWA